jgi:3-methyladenine DNA glycosylase/8-oxoguanine DNA glycosylase
VIEDVVRPRGPYRLHLMTYGLPFEPALPGGGRGLAWQGTDGLVRLRAPDEERLELLRFMLALDADTSEFVARFRRDPLLGPSLRHLHGLRPLRRATVAHAVLRAMCGQLIEARRALAIERAILRSCGQAAPTRQALGARSPSELRRLGLATHRASALIRICRSLDLEGLRGRPVEAVAARLLRERGIGPWSLGVIGLEGLGSYRYGLVGDLGLLKLCASLWGRWVELEETAELLQPYGDWAGLAGVYLMAGFGRGLVPGANPDAARLVRFREASRAA